MINFLKLFLLILLVNSPMYAGKKTSSLLRNQLKKISNKTCKKTLQQQGEWDIEEDELRTQKTHPSLIHLTPAIIFNSTTIKCYGNS